MAENNMRVPRSLIGASDNDHEFEPQVGNLGDENEGYHVHVGAQVEAGVSKTDLDKRPKGPVQGYERRKRGGHKLEGIFAAGDEEDGGGISNEPVDWKRPDPTRPVERTSATGAPKIGVYEPPQPEIPATIPELKVVSPRGSEWTDLNSQEPDKVLLLQRLLDKQAQAEGARANGASPENIFPLSPAEEAQLKALRAELRGGRAVEQRALWDRRARIFGTVPREMQAEMRTAKPGFMLISNLERGVTVPAGSIEIRPIQVVNSAGFQVSGLEVVAVNNVHDINVGDRIEASGADPRYARIETAALLYDNNAAPLEYSVGAEIRKIAEAARKKAAAVRPRKKRSEGISVAA